RSDDGGVTWRRVGSVWPTGGRPAWIAEEVPGVTNLWAPELHEHDGTWYLYYAASTFGSNHSAIGLATATTLDPDDPAYGWTDRGPVLVSEKTDDVNAIDPAVIDDAEGRPWLAFGSFWSGIRMLPLSWPGGLLAEGASLDDAVLLAGGRGGPNAIEAPSITRHGDAFWLFASIG
ncbi:arabinan endo-1,5-alpha-L-arabinosidase, partial [Schumannella luteola]